MARTCFVSIERTIVECNRQLLPERVIVGVAVGERRSTYRTSGGTSCSVLRHAPSGPAHVLVDDGHLLSGGAGVESVVGADDGVRRAAEGAVVEGDGEGTADGVVEHRLRLRRHALYPQVRVDVLRRLDRRRLYDRDLDDRRLDDRLLLRRVAALTPGAVAVTAVPAAVHQSEYQQKGGDQRRYDEQRPKVGAAGFVQRLAEGPGVSARTFAVVASRWETVADAPVVAALGWTWTVV